MQTAKTKPLDCIVIGYNEVPFQQYESFLHNYGVETEAYRDLQYSFVNLAGEKLDYVGLLNRVLQQAGKSETFGRLKSGDIPNLAAVYLTNYLRRRGLAADYINLFQDEKEQLIEYLAAGPLCVAITTTFYLDAKPIREIVDFVRKHSTDTKIIVGGPHIFNLCDFYDPADDGLAFVLEEMGADIYPMTKFKRSNQNTCINQKPIVRVGQKVHKGQVMVQQCEVRMCWPPPCDTVQLTGLPADMDEEDIELVLTSSKYGALSGIVTVTKVDGKVHVKLDSEQGLLTYNRCTIVAAVMHMNCLVLCRIFLVFETV